MLCAKVNITRLPSPFGSCINASEPGRESLNAYQRLHDGVEYSALVTSSTSSLSGLSHYYYYLLGEREAMLRRVLGFTLIRLCGAF